MPGIPSKTFELEIASLWPKEVQGVPGQEIAPGLKEFLEPKRWEQLSMQTVVPLGLRWRVTPEMGLPRTPFSVWRRDRSLDDPIDVQFDATQVNNLHLGNGVYHVPSTPLYILIVKVHNLDPANAVTVQALDGVNNPILLQSVTVPANSLRMVRFQHPFIGGFSCKGSIISVTAVTMKAFIERKEEWQLLEIVGLPCKAGEISGYDAQKQGYPTQLKDPRDAALVRLLVAQQFYLPLANNLPSGVNVPLWEIPQPNEALDELISGSPSLVQQLSAMLQAVDSGTVGTQAEYRTDINVPGIKQPDFPNKVTADATMNIPLLATLLLNAVTDPWFALASGFGTTDFPEFFKPSGPSERFLEPSTYFSASHDYMVSATFTFRVFNAIEFETEHCALSHRSGFPPIQPGALMSEIYAQNRPPQRDEPWSAEIALTWAKINRLQIQGNAVAVAINSLSGAYPNLRKKCSRSGTFA